MIRRAGSPCCRVPCSSPAPKPRVSLGRQGRECLRSSSGMSRRAEMCWALQSTAAAAQPRHISMQMQSSPGSLLTGLRAAGEDYSGCVKTIIWTPQGGKLPPICPQIRASLGLLTAEPHGDFALPGFTFLCPLSLILLLAALEWLIFVIRIPLLTCSGSELCSRTGWSLLVLLPPHATQGAEGKCSGRGLNLDFYPSENFVISADVVCSKAVKSLLFIGEKRKMDLLISVQS